MRTAVRSVLVAIGTATTVVAGPAGTGLAAMSPADGSTITSVLPAQDQVVGVAHPVVVTFGAPVANRRAAERAIRVTSEPSMTGRFEWLDANVVQWVPHGYWPAHSVVALSVGGRPATFRTGPLVLGIADISDHTFTVSIDGVDAPGEPHGLRVLPASAGRPEYPTPVGSYTVLEKKREVIMDSSTVGIPVDAPDGYKMTVDFGVRITNRGLYVHSAPWAVSSMGMENTSHGCVGLAPIQAEWYFNAATVGDPVRIQE